ncbi:Guanylate cyclase 32E [Trichoplax sp. H2]|nr:Guanylate cyclase 32E [Trichoplax sp. H2]|eukprot:RDD35992.1 Guanylate cyclase 32E [Trichoplax sp. H2]
MPNKAKSCADEAEDSVTDVAWLPNGITKSRQRRCHGSNCVQISSRHAELIKMTILILIPCIALASVTTVALIKDSALYGRAFQTKQEIIIGENFAKLIHLLQLERGQTVILVSSNYSKLTYESVKARRKLTDEAIDLIMTWLPITGNSNTAKPVYNGTTLRNYLISHRTNVVDQFNTTVLNELEFYSDIVYLLLNRVTVGLFKAKYDNLWNHLVGYCQLIAGKEESGIERALGGAYFSQFQLSHNEIIQYYAKLQLGLMNINSARQYSYYINNLYEQYVLNTSIFNEVQNLRQIVISNQRHNPSVIKANIWFSNLTLFINTLEKIRIEAAALIQMESDKVINMATVDFALSVGLLTSAIIICPLLLYITTKLTRNIYLYAQDLADKTEKLMRERKKTNTLLFRMLPRTVAEQLKQGKAVVAETYDDVTVYFSDIVGFTEICHTSTAMQVVEMLNYLYVQFDSRLENYQVYKVETIGDAYMVVSGLPKRLDENRHADEIANMALDLLELVGNLKIPHNPTYDLKLRAGIHSGACVAGVIGMKMPRYCLFGDTVNTASRMESNGEASRIHCSQASYDLLSKTRQYELTLRGEINIKGLGAMKTYWLLGRMITLNVVYL